MCFSWVLPASTSISPDFAGRARPSTTLESRLPVPTYPCLGKKPAKLICLVFSPLIQYAVGPGSPRKTDGQLHGEKLLLSCLV